MISVGVRLRSPRSNFKISPRIPKSNSQGVGPKFLYPRNRNDSLNHFQFFRNKKIAHRKKLWRFQTPEFNLSMKIKQNLHTRLYLPVKLNDFHLYISANRTCVECRGPKFEITKIFWSALPASRFDRFVFYLV